MKQQHFGGRLALLTAALIWGSSFIIMKDAVSGVPVFRLLALRFTIAAAVLAIIFCRKLLFARKELLLHGGICGVLLLAAYSVQTFGLLGTTPGKNAFLTAVYCVLVPFLTWGLTRRAPKGRNWLAAVLCLCGIGLVSLTGDLTMSRGDALTLVGGVFFALHIMALTTFTPKHDATALTIVQFAVVAVLSWLLSALTERPLALPTAGWPQLLYLAILCTGVTLLLQSIGQKLTPPSQAAILLSLESVFGIIFSVLLGAEALNPRMVCGFSLIFVSVIVSEAGLPKLRKSSSSAPTDMV